MAATKAVQRPHWYRVTVTECPVCGSGSIDRERVYGKRPKSEAKRFVYLDIGCAGAAGCYSWL